MTVHPYKIFSQSASSGAQDVSMRPTYSIIDPDSVSPLRESGFASYGNLRVSSPGTPHTRGLGFTELGI